MLPNSQASEADSIPENPNFPEPSGAGSVLSALPQDVLFWPNLALKLGLTSCSWHADAAETASPKIIAACERRGSLFLNLLSLRITNEFWQSDSHSTPVSL